MYDGVGDVVFFYGVEELVGFFEGCCHGFFRDDGDTCLRGFDDVFGVQVMGSGDDDGVEFGAGEHVAVVFVALF